MITYPASTGRNFVEVLRVIDSLQLTANYSVATPADWKAGEDVIVVPAVSTEDAIKKFPKGVKVVKPYLRYTPAAKSLMLTQELIQEIENSSLPEAIQLSRGIVSRESCVFFLSRPGRSSDHRCHFQK